MTLLSYPLVTKVENLSARARGERDHIYQLPGGGQQKPVPDMRGRIQLTADSHERKARAAHSAAGDHDKNENKNNRYPDVLAEPFTYTILLSPRQPQKVNTMNLIL